MGGGSDGPPKRIFPNISETANAIKLFFREFAEGSVVVIMQKELLTYSFLRGQKYIPRNITMAVLDQSTSILRAFSLIDLIVLNVQKNRYNLNCSKSMYQFRNVYINALIFSLLEL